MAEIQEKGGGGGKGGKKRSKKQSTRIDMTPMVDLGFLLLTFFILTTTFAKPQTMEINMPVKDVKPEEQQALKASNALTLIADEKDQLFWYAGLPDNPTEPGVQLTDYSANGLRKILLDRRSNPNLTVLLKQTDKSRYKNMVDMLDEMNITGIRKYAIVDVDPRDTKLIADAKAKL
ncbi:ExbD/TolR family protein [Adhaeribacter radiodurans]|uniref:Biopolymer transporter ExbD n=1 Tax=Adhaeribacter radiodurans TaxID=2745197 RepID=A0A7L7L2I8_9BACT|nr:biopolymer transporter ExbD [Adhaeribacter radiodurans]QMU27004.1 biopolymer transporter ExbD [Adhaeribacter radiodurans]